MRSRQRPVLSPAGSERPPARLPGLDKPVVHTACPGRPWEGLSLAFRGLQPCRRRPAQPAAPAGLTLTWLASGKASLTFARASSSSALAMRSTGGCAATSAATSAVGSSCRSVSSCSLICGHGEGEQVPAEVSPGRLGPCCGERQNACPPPCLPHPGDAPPGSPPAPIGWPCARGRRVSYAAGCSACQAAAPGAAAPAIRGSQPQVCVGAPHGRHATATAQEAMQL